VTIGDGVIVSPLSFVETDLPDGSVYSGRQIRGESDMRIEALERQVAELARRLAAQES